MSIVKYIPNTITAMNLVCGMSGILCTFYGRLDLAFYFMLAATVFDFCDGFAARVLNATSEIGKQLDSLCDLVSFGLLPAFMLHRLMVLLRGGLDFWCFIPLVLAVFSALRLAKFNVDERQTTSFIGLPTPACALFCGSLVHYAVLTPDSACVPLCASKFYLPIIAVILSALLVSEIPMFSLKFKKGVQRDSLTYRLRIGLFGGCVASTIFVILIGQKFSLIFTLAILIYILINVIEWIVLKVRRQA